MIKILKNPNANEKICIAKKIIRTKATPDNARPIIQVEVSVQPHCQVSMEPALETLPSKRNHGRDDF